MELFEALRAYLYKGRSRIAPDRLESLSQGMWRRVLICLTELFCLVVQQSQYILMCSVRSLLTRFPNFYEFDVTCRRLV